MNLHTVTLSEPQTQKEFEAYYLLRYEVLRKPWNQPAGSEKDDLEPACIHLMACDKNEHPVGVCRLQFNSATTAQIRYMAVRTDTQHKGIGKQLLAYAETKAIQKGAERLTLQARETAVAFYKKCGYSLVEKTHLMWNEVQHYLMEKKLNSR